MTCSQKTCDEEAIVSYEWAGQVLVACVAHTLAITNIAEAIGMPLIFRTLDGQPVGRFEPSS